MLLLIKDDNKQSLLGRLKDAFSVEKVTDEFFKEYQKLLGEIKDLLDLDQGTRKHLLSANVDSSGFAKKLLGQIVFLYFLQKKGWLGVKKDDKWGSGPKKFFREMYSDKCENSNGNFFNDVLEPLFYEALNVERKKDYYAKLACRIPFLNGGLFEPYKNYSWGKRAVSIPNSIFSNSSATGILDIFDRYNFTVSEDAPLDKEVAVDPEMLGKIFESLLDEDVRKATGTFYTPREIVHFMCQESILLYLQKQFKGIKKSDLEKLIKAEDSYVEANDLTAFKPPESVEMHAREIDKKLGEVTMCDPAVGSGAFPVEFMHVIVNIRSMLDPYIRNGNTMRKLYDLKRDCIKNCIFGIDIDDGAVEIARLRLWLSLIVDEVSRNDITPLPNLDHKIIKGNSLTGHFVGQDIFKEHGAAELIKLAGLRSQHFEESDRDKKHKINEKIAKKRREMNIEGLGIVYKADFYEAFVNNRGGFDIVIGNPPYIGEKGNKDIFKPVRQSDLQKFCTGKMDYFYLFFHLALAVTRESGAVVFITTNYYVTAFGAQKLRHELWEKSTIKRLINFGECKVFESASGQHNMISIFTNCKNSQSFADITVVKDKPSHEDADRTKKSLHKDRIHKILSRGDSDTKYFRRSQKELYSNCDKKYIRLIEPKHKEILDLIFAKGKPLKETLNISQGVLARPDRATEKDIKKYGLPARQGDGIFVISNDEIKQMNINEYEKGLIMPYFKGTDINCFYALSGSVNHLIYSTRESLYREMPNIIRHLRQYKRMLVERRDNGEEGWYQLHRPRDKQIFNGPKIVAPYLTRVNAFAYNEIPWYGSGDVYFMKVFGRDLKQQHILLKYVLALLNSRLYYFWLYNNGKRRGDDLNLQAESLEEIAIKIVDQGKQMPFVELVDKILNLFNGGKLITEATKSEALQYYEKINQKVYELYKLSEEQIETVDNFAKEMGVYDIYS